MALPLKCGVLALAPILAAAEKVKCADFTGRDYDSSASYCPNTNTGYCGMNDVCCTAGCAPLTSACAGYVGYCELNQQPKCMDGLGGCCCAEFGDSSCNDYSTDCSGGSAPGAEMAGISVGVVCVLIACCVVTMICIRRSRRERMNETIKSQSYQPPTHTTTIIHANPAPPVASVVPPMARPVIPYGQPVPPQPPYGYGQPSYQAAYVPVPVPHQQQYGSYSDAPPSYDGPSAPPSDGGYGGASGGKQVY